MIASRRVPIVTPARAIGVHAVVVGAAVAQRRAHRPHRASVGVVRAPCDPAHPRNIAKTTRTYRLWDDRLWALLGVLNLTLRSYR